MYVDNFSVSNGIVEVSEHNFSHAMPALKCRHEQLDHDKEGTRNIYLGGLLPLLGGLQ